MRNGDSPSKSLISIEDALSATPAEVAGWVEHLNPGIALILRLLDFDRVFRKAEGVCLWDSEGNEYLDFQSNYGSLSLGHNHPRVLASINAVGAAPNFVQWISYAPLSAALAANLASVTPGDLSNSYLCNSGAEATEAALKLARAATGRTHIISTHNSFHGKTMGALSVTGREAYRKPLEPLLAGVTFVPFGELDPLDEALRAQPTAAFIVEPIQGEGGVIVPPEGYLREAARLCRDHGALFILDEIQTGLGRTGRLFACQWENVRPDAMILGKALSGGFYPVSAFVADEAVMGVFKPGDHGSTFGGNPLGAAIGRAALRVLIEEKLADRARELGDWFMGELRKIESPAIREVRGKGLLIGVELTGPARPYCEALAERGILCKETHDLVLRFAPPLVVAKADLEWALPHIAEVLAMSFEPEMAGAR